MIGIEEMQAAISYLGTGPDHVIENTLKRLEISEDDFALFVQECTRHFYGNPVTLLEILLGQDEFMEYKHGFIAGFMISCQLLNPGENSE